MTTKENIIAGISSLLDIFVTRHYSEYDNFNDKSGFIEDYNALKSDWIAVGKDIESVLVSEYTKED